MLRRVIDRRGRPRHFKAKLTVYYLLGWVVILTFLSFSYQGLKADWMIAGANEDLTKMKAASHPVQDLHQAVAERDGEIADLKERFDELMKNPITFKQTYFLETEILPRTRKHGIPDSLAASQWALESNRQVHRPGHNYWGIMQWDKDRVRSLRTFSTLDDAIAMYAGTIKSILKRKGYTYDPNEDPISILKKLQEGTPRYEGDNEDTMIYVNHISSLKEFSYYKK